MARIKNFAEARVWEYYNIASWSTLAVSDTMSSFSATAGTITSVELNATITCITDTVVS